MCPAVAVLPRPTAVESLSPGLADEGCKQHWDLRLGVSRILVLVELARGSKALCT